MFLVGYCHFYINKVINSLNCNHPEIKLSHTHIYQNGSKRFLSISFHWQTVSLFIQHHNWGPIFEDNAFITHSFQDICIFVCIPRCPKVLLGFSFLCLDTALSGIPFWSSYVIGCSILYSWIVMFWRIMFLLWKYNPFIYVFFFTSQDC